MSVSMGNRTSSISPKGEECTGSEVVADHDTPREPSTPHDGATSASGSPAHPEGLFTNQYRQPFEPATQQRAIPRSLIAPTVFEQNGFCKYCQSIALDDGGGDVRLAEDGERSLEFSQSQLHFHYERRLFSLVKETAEGGCSLCQLMVHSFGKYCELNSDHVNRFEVLEVTGMSYRWVDGLQSLDVDFLFTQQQNGPQKQTMAFPITAHPASSTVWLRIQKKPRFKRLLAEDGICLSQDVREMLKKLVHSCTRDCDPKTEPAVLPKRLLDVKGTENGARICLIEVGKIPHMKMQWEYATLSYCWGRADKQPIKTTRANLDEMTTGVSIEGLPRSYQDAIIVCRNLDIPFLWIDALCIIQDDKEEWELEAWKVACLYQQALITIIPSAAQSAYDGFLQRSLPARHPVEVEFNSVLDRGITGSYFINEPDFSDTPLFYRDTVKTKWGNRGWTFNERLFSTRRVYFGAETIHWSCRGFYMSELDYSPQAAEEYNLKSLTGEPGLGAGENIYFFWCSQFLEYSCRQFTFWNDRLPAISALASFIADITDDKWLAGIWESDMHIELLWSATRFRGSVLLPTSSEYIAPSWSWLARAQNAEISHISIQQNLSFITLLDARIELDGANPFGRVSDGYLELEGIVCALSAEDFHEVSDERSPIYQEIRREGRYVGDCAFDRDLFDDEDEEDQGTDRGLLNAETFVLLPIRNGLCLKRTKSRAGLERITEEQVDSTISGLVLVPSGRTGNIFCRAGIFESPPIENGGPAFFECWAKQKITII